MQLPGPSARLERHRLHDGEGIDHAEGEALLAEGAQHRGCAIEAVANRKVVDEARLLGAHVTTDEAIAAEACHIHAPDSGGKLGIAHGHNHAARLAGADVREMELLGEDGVGPPGLLVLGDEHGAAVHADHLVEARVHERLDATVAQGAGLPSPCRAR